MAWALSSTDADAKKKRDGYARQPADEEPEQAEIPCDQPGYGKSCWGMTQDEVRQVYRDVANVTPHKLGQGRSVATLDALTLFLFGERGLANVTVAFRVNHYTDYQGYVRDYERVNEKLRNKYGESATEGATWNSEIFREDQAAWGLALFNGDVVFATSWAPPGTIIAHTLSRTLAGIEHSIVYESTELAGATIEMEEKDLGKEGPTVPGAQGKGKSGGAEGGGGK